MTVATYPPVIRAVILHSPGLSSEKSLWLNGVPVYGLVEFVHYQAGIYRKHRLVVTLDVDELVVEYPDGTVREVELP